MADTKVPRQVLVVMGVSGSGKSTVAGLLAERLDWPCAEGDDLHPPANVDKMAAGTPLTDEDRWPWLDVVRRWIDSQIAADQPGIITCSALKKSYRDVLRAEDVVFVYLHGEPAQLQERITGRSGHYMPASLLDSQLATLEPPTPDESALTVSVDGTPQQIAEDVMAQLQARSRRSA